jgi:hypothetical protein
MAETTLLAPLCVPVEIAPARALRGGRPAGLDSPRWFRLCLGLTTTPTGGEGEGAGPGLLLRTPLPEELRGEALRVRFHLPPPTERLAALLGGGSQGEISAHARAEELRVDRGTERERAELRLVHLVNLDAATQEQLLRYATLRNE